MDSLSLILLLSFSFSFIKMRYKSLSVVVVVVAAVVCTHCKCEIYSWHQFGGTQCVILNQTRESIILFQLPSNSSDGVAAVAVAAAHR